MPMTMRLLRAALAAVGLLVQPLHAADATWTPTRGDIAHIEAGLKLPMVPTPSGPLKDYERYYAGIVRNGHRMIRAEFVALGITPQARGQVHITSEDKFPVIMDGGCGIVSLLYDVEAGRIVSVGCNGLA
jgi:hypothetical protein